MATGEWDLIRAIRTRTPPSAGVIVGPGDDTAVLARPSRELLATTDVLTEGVDFLLADASPYQIGRKAMAVNLSDIAAMAGRPTAALVGLVLPRSATAIAEELDRGLRAQAEEFQVPIIGGDTNTWDGGLVVSVTVLGEPTGQGPVLRSGARPGDGIYVTGRLGGSILGRHLAPHPRIREAQALHELGLITAMIDISDGLASDLHHICEESGLGAELIAEAIPIHPDAVQLATQTGKSPLRHALGDGEDFELIFTVKQEMECRLSQAQVEVYKIGTMLPGGFWLVVDGERRSLDPVGWEHTFTQP